MRSGLRTILFMILLGLLPGSLPAAELSPLEVAARLQAAYEQTYTLTATFQQVTTSQMSSRRKEGNGTLVLAKPGLMRWDYLEPDRQVFVCDGKRISMYLAKEEQMVVTDAAQYLESDVTYSFFAGSGNIIKDFEVMAPEEEDMDGVAHLHHLKIIPKKGHPQVDFIHIWVARDSYLLKRIQVTDKFGATTDITFLEIKRNIDVDKGLFSFTPPEGTEIVEQ